MEILKLQTRDVINNKKTVQELLKECFQSAYGDEDLDEIIIAKYESLIENIESGKAHTFGAVKDGCLAGFLWGYPVKTHFETVFHIAYLSVMEGGRRLGIGEKLLDKAEKECKKLGYDHIELIVGAENDSALRFYDYCGYKSERLIMRKEVR